MQMALKTYTNTAKLLILSLLLIMSVAFILLVKCGLETMKQHSVSLQTELLTLPIIQNEPENIDTTISNASRPEWNTLNPQLGDTLTALLARAGIRSSDTQAILDIPASKKYLQRLHPGQKIKIQVSQDNELLAYTQVIGKDRRLKITKNAQNLYQAIIESIPLETRITFGQVTITDSLFLSSIRAGLDDALIMNLAEIFAYDIDFALDIRPGDTFSMLYEEQYLEGEKISNGHIVAAEFKTQNHLYQAIRYMDQSGKVDYFNPSGTGLHKIFIRTPVNYTRISSHFNLKRKHPILHKIRAHKGVDYAAPRGTPVKSVGDGYVTFLGKKGGYGNTLVIQHGKKQGKHYTTLYAHLSRFAPPLKVGSKIKQGQVVAYVGSTGLATAPHLHYEFHVNGIHHNPLTVALPKAEGLQGSQAPRFVEHSKKILTLMAYHEAISNNTMLASNE